MLKGEFVLSFRNLIGDRRRTVLALFAVVFGVIAQLFVGGFIDWIFWAMRESYIRGQLGHIQIVRSGYHEDGQARPFEYLLPKEAAIIDEIQRMPAISELEPRLKFNGLVSFGETTVSFQGDGVEPKPEPEASQNPAAAKVGGETQQAKDLKKLITVRLRAGKGLSPEESRGIIIGSGLAANLGVKPGDTVVLMANTASGGLNAVEVKVNGIFYTATKQYDDLAIRTHIKLAQELLRIDGVHEWILTLTETELTRPTLAHIQERLKSVGQNLQAVPWYDLADFYNKTVVLFSHQVDVIRIIVSLLVMLSISNVLVMSVLDRTSEIGTLMAIGIRRNSILRIFLFEGLLMGIGGVVVGLMIGFVLAHIVSTIGIPMPPPPGMGVGFVGEIMLSPTLASSAAITSLVTAACAGLYAAHKASRLVIVNALRTSR